MAICSELYASGWSGMFLTLTLSHSREEHSGQRLGGRPPLDNHVWRHLLHVNWVSGWFHLAEPQPGQREGLPSWEFHSWSHLRHFTLRWGWFHLMDLHEGQRAGDSCLRGNHV